MNARAAFLTVAGFCASAGGQTPSFTYQIDVANTNLAPGETTTVTVLCGFSPGIGSLVNTWAGPQPVEGLASGAFDLIGSDGTWALALPPNGSLIAPYNFLGTTHGTAVGGSVTGVLWGNGFSPPYGSVSTVNPTPLWQGTFTAPATGPVTLDVNPQGQQFLWAGIGFHSWEVTGPATGGHAAINVIPSPSALASFAFAGAAAPFRRRTMRFAREVSSRLDARNAHDTRAGDSR